VLLLPYLGVRVIGTRLMAHMVIMGMYVVITWLMLVTAMGAAERDDVIIVYVVMVVSGAVVAAGVVLGC